MMKSVLCGQKTLISICLSGRVRMPQTRKYYSNFGYLFARFAFDAKNAQRKDLQPSQAVIRQALCTVLVIRKQ